MIRGTKSSWRAVIGVPSELILGLRLFNVLNDDLDDGTESTCCEFAGDKRLGGVVHRPGGCVAIQRDLSRLEKWAGLHLGSSSFPSICLLALSEKWLGPSSSNCTEKLF